MLLKYAHLLVGRAQTSLRATALVLPFVTAAAAYAQTATVIEEQYKQIKAPHAFSKIGTDLFGDKVNLYNGTAQFIQTDISLPGNNELAVELGRRFSAGQRIMGSRPFGRWDFEIPHLHGLFGATDGWKSNVYAPGTRCTSFGPPPTTVGGPTRAAWDPEDFWNGSFLYVPGQGDQQLLARSSDFTAAPGPVADYPIVTSSLWSVSCLPNLANDSSTDHKLGEGFVAVSPNGVKYRFDWMASYPALSLTRSSEIEPGASDALARKEVWMFPTLVTDRFGNWVRYTYDPVVPTHLLRIESSDGRAISFTYDAQTTSGRVLSATDGTRTWNYRYNTTDLSGITLPDGSSWQFSNSDEVNRNVNVSPAQSCDTPVGFSSDPRVFTMTHPSGATGTFTFRGTAHGRAGIPKTCESSNFWVQRPAMFYYTEALSTKTISGPGLATMSWNYDYGTPTGSYAPCDGACARSKTVSVTDPGGVTTRYTFGNHYRYTEGRLEQVSVGNLRTTTTRYRPFNAGPYASVYGYNYGGGRDGDSDISVYIAPVDQRITSQEGVDFVWEADPNAFDLLGRATVVNRYSSLGYRRVDRTDYADKYPLWVLNKVAKLTETQTGKVEVLNTYDSATANLLSVSRFGSLATRYTYNADSTVATEQDGRLQTTTYSNFKRGIPQSIRYADGSTQSAVVNDIGKITSLTNEVGSTHTFGYDAMGRLASIAYPAADSVAWNQTTLSFAPIGAQEYDLGAGHWKQTVTTGGATEINYLDALWRPVYVERYDSADVANTSRIVKHQYDFEGRTTFESYPQRSYGSIAGGVSSGYDALGRLTTRSIGSELGPLNEYYGYISGFQKSYTDAKGNTAYTSYQAFDQPSEDAITGITMPEGVALSIARDVFGKTKSITRSGAGLSQTRSYVYDGYERLCKTIEPETGATVQDYDLADNVAWRATGLALPSTTSCDTTSVAAAKKMAFTYDLRNRLKDTTFGDGSAAINRTYTLDGLQDTVSSNGSKWTYSYNKRRLLEGESLAYGSTTYAIGRSYDANGSLSQLRYPGNNLTVAYNPNALGEPRQAGTYATGVTYHPSGAIAGFTYGNGIRRTMAQNVRGLPSRSTDAGVLDESYTYDKNANVESIVDQLQSVATRSMTYDGLNRLKTTTAPSLWGTATYGYDTLDNLTSTAISGGANTRTTIHNIDYTTNRLASITNGPAKFSFTYGYDGQGNITSRGAQSYTFDMANRMTAAPGRATYVYDGLGRRVSVVGTDGVNRVQVYSQGGQLLYVAPTSGTATKYVYLHNHQIAEVK